VCLDPVLRQKVEGALLARLRDPRIPLPIREDCVLLGLALRGCGPDFARAAAPVALAAMESANDPHARHELAMAVAALAPQLGRPEMSRHAERAARLALQRSRATIREVAPYENAHALRELAVTLEALAPWLDPKVLARYAGLTLGDVLKEMGKGPGLRRLS